MDDFFKTAVETTKTKNKLAKRLRNAGEPIPNQVSLGCTRTRGYFTTNRRLSQKHTVDEILKMPPKLNT